MGIESHHGLTATDKKSDKRGKSKVPTGCSTVVGLQAENELQK